MLLVIEGFDTYDTGNYQGKWSSMDGTIGGAYGRKGTNGLWHWDAMNLSYSAGDNPPTIIFGYAFKVSGVGDWELVDLRDGATVQLRIECDSSNQILIKRGSTIISYTGYVVPTNTWVYLEFKATIDNSAGSYELRINGITKDSQSGIDTSNSGNAWANVVHFYMRDPGQSSMVDDIYIFDDQGAFCNDFVGDVHVEAIFPNGVGYVTDWVGVPGVGDNYEEVDEAILDDDTTFVVTSGVGLEDSYEFSDLVTLSGSVFCVQVNLWGRKDDVGSRTVVGITRPISTTYSGIGISLGDSYQYTLYQFEANPETSINWTIPEINAAEFGIREEA